MIDFCGVKTPCYVIDRKAITENLEILKRVKEAAGCRILLAQKAFSCYALYPLMLKYLDGTTDSDGKLTSANSVNVRFQQGTGFKLTMDQFSFSNINGGEIPGTDFLISEADGAERGILIPSENIILNGVNLWKDGDMGTKVSFYLIDQTTGEASDTAAAVVTNFLTEGPNALKFAWPSSLASGASYLAVPARSADGERWYEGSGKAASVKEVE